MTTSSPKPRRRHGKFLIALFAATAAIAGGGRAAVPPPAAAMTDDGAGTECAPWETEFFNDCTEASGGSTGGSTGNGGPIVGGEVIRVESTIPEVKLDNRHACGNEGVVCFPLPGSPGPSRGEAKREWQKTLKREVERQEEADARRVRKKEEDQKYAECVKGNKKHALASQKHICPQYCQADDKYHTPLDDDNECTIRLIPNAQTVAGLTLDEFQTKARECRRIWSRLQGLEKLAGRMKEKGSYSDEIWRGHGYRQREIELSVDWAISDCEAIYIES